MSHRLVLVVCLLALATAGCDRAGVEATPSGTDHADHGSPPARTDEHADHTTAGKPGEAALTPETPPDGYSTITLSPSARGLALTTAPVEESQFTRGLRTVGVVVLDETKTSHVHSKVRGWIESIHVDFIGKRVRSGQPLVTIYSQEVYAAELEYLSVVRQPVSGAAVTSEFAATERAAREQLVAAARQRLELWDVPRDEIDRLESTHTPRKTFTLNAPRTGIVVAKQAVAGMFIDPSLELYLISDIRTLWVLADVYASDISSVRLGDSARLSVEGGGPESIAANVAFIPPTIDEATRTLKVRFEVDNEDGRLRPGAFVTVEMAVALGRGLSIPEDAVIHAGPREIVFVVQGDRVEPRQVQIGPNVAGRYRVEKGLRAGERVATGAQFLLDSESRLRASSAPGGAHVGH